MSCLLLKKIFTFAKTPCTAVVQSRKCHSLFGIKELIEKEKPKSFSLVPVESNNHNLAVDIVKRFFLSEHVLVRARNINFAEDRAIDEYLVGLLKQGNSIFAKTEEDTVAGLCVNFAASPVDPQNLRSYAFYRQDPNTKDFLCFTAKLQGTPNLWNIFKQSKVFEIKMLAVLPEFRRKGIAIMLAEKSKELAKDQGYKVLRMDCINPYDYKIAERCMLSCLFRYPLHKLRGANAPFIKKTSEYNRYIRVYVGHSLKDAPDTWKPSQADLESMIE